MSAHEMLIYIMAGFAVLGALDRIFGNRFGLGQEFENGILAMGSLAVAMLGIICLAPVLASLLAPVVVPVYSFLGADPAMFAGTILACDMGGAALAQELALTPEAAAFGGLLAGSMLGATIVFTIPKGNPLRNYYHPRRSDRRRTGGRLPHYHGTKKSDPRCYHCCADCLRPLEVGKSHDQRLSDFWKRCHHPDHRRLGSCHFREFNRHCANSRLSAPI